MTTAATKPAPAKKPAPKPAAKNGNGKGDDRPIVYPVLTINGVPIPEDKLVITEAQAEKILGWETEPDYAARILASDPKKKGAQFGENFLLENTAGQKVRCERNSRNRPFDEPHSRKLAQDILSGHWRMNCETIIISKHADTDSGQHRLIGLKLACEMWRKNPDSYPAWPKDGGPPFIRSLIVFGADDSPETLRTLDNVKPRSLTDVFYTSPLFAKLDAPERKECSRMMDYCVDLLWARLALGKVGGEKVYQSHSASIEFADAHPSIKKCVKHVFEENKEHRSISSLNISAGHTAAMQYLMSASGSEDVAEEYFISFPRTEKRLTLDQWDKAESFVTELAAVDRVETEHKDGTTTVEFEGTLAAVAEALTNLVDPDGEDGAKGSNIEKLAIISKSWLAFRDRGEVGPADVDLTDHYHQDEETKAWSFINEPTVGGIDRGSGKTGADRQLEKAAVEEAKEKAKAEKLAKMDAKAKGKAAAAGPVVTPTEAMAAELSGQFKKIHDANPGLLIVIKSQLGNYAAWMDDAKVVAEAAHGKTSVHKGSQLHQFVVPHKDFEAVVGRLQKAGHKIGIALYDPATKVYAVTPVPPPAEKPPLEMKADMSKPTPVKPQPRPNPKPAGLRGGTN